MKGFTKKVLAGLLSATLVMSSSMVAFAAEGDEGNTGTSTGTGTLEGILNTDVFDVELPTVPENDTTFDFIVDPEGLIAETEALKYSGATFEEGKILFFKNISEQGTSYSSTSDGYSIKNRSTMDVDVTLEAEATLGAEGLKLTDDSTFTEDETTSIYLAMKSGETTKAIMEGGSSMTVMIEKAPEGAYEVIYDTETTKYDFVMTDEAKAEGYVGFKTMSFNMVGAANPTEGIDWSALEQMAPTVQITWTVAEHSELPDTSSISALTIPESGNVTAKVTIGKDSAELTSITAAEYKGELLTQTNGWGVTYDATKGVVTFDDGVSGDLIGGKTYTFTATFTPAEGDAYTQVIQYPAGE